MMLTDPNTEGAHLSKTLHIHGCSQCDRDYLSYYVKPPIDGKCAHCVKKTYHDAKRDLWLRAETLRAFREDEESTSRGKR